MKVSIFASLVTLLLLSFASTVLAEPGVPRTGDDGRAPCAALQDGHQGPGNAGSGGFSHHPSPVSPRDHQAMSQARPGPSFSDHGAGQDHWAAPASNHHEAMPDNRPHFTEPGHEVRNAPLPPAPAPARSDPPHGLAFDGDKVVIW